MTEQSEKQSVDGERLTCITDEDLATIENWVLHKWKASTFFPKDAHYLANATALMIQEVRATRLTALAGPLEQPPKIETLDQFFAEAKRTGLTASALAAALSTRPEFADCLPETTFTLDEIGDALKGLSDDWQELVALRLAAKRRLEQPQEPKSDKGNLAQASGVCDLQTALPEQHTRRREDWLLWDRCYARQQGKDALSFLDCVSLFADVVRNEAVRDQFTDGVNAAAAMLDKMADEYAAEHSTQDSETGVWEFGRHGEDYYNTLRELADNVRSIVLHNRANPSEAA